MTTVVLGSASAGRLRVLRQAGLDPLVVVSGVDEDALLDGLPDGADPATAVTALAEAKAVAVSRAVGAEVAADAVVIGCDSMLFFAGRLRGKPESAEQARRRWAEMAGRAGLLYTGHCVVRLRGGAAVRTEVAAGVTEVRFGVPSDADLDAYLASGEPLQVAGAFTLDGLGGWFVDGIDGDPSNVIGISLPVTRRLLAAVGLEPGRLWRGSVG